MSRLFTRRFYPLFLHCIVLLFPFKGFAAIPKAPTTLAAVAASTSQITLTWVDASTDETGFELEQSTNGTTFAKIADLAANVVIYQNTALKSATKYWYRVRAKNASGVSAYSNVANATTLTVTIPKAPSGMTAAAVSSSQINVSWTDNAGDEAGFELETSTDALSFTKIADLEPNVTSYQHTGLTPLAKRWYRVLAKNSAGKSAYSNIANATTRDVAPAAPSNLTLTSVSTSQIDLTWKDNAGNETGFQIERSADGNAFTKIADVAANTVKYENAGLAMNTLYYYRVRAVNAIGTSAYSNVSSVKTQNIPPPNAPLNFTAVPISLDIIQLRWTKATGNATELVIERAKNGDEQFDVIKKLPATAIDFQDTDELEPADYYYRIKAVNAGGDSPYSAIAIVRAASIITAVEDPADQHTVYAFEKTLIVELSRQVTGTVRVYDLTGTARHESAIGRHLRLSLDLLPAGIYIVSVDTGKESLSKRVLLY